MSAKYIRPNVRVKSTKNAPNPSDYILALKGEFSHLAFDEEQCPDFKGRWRDDIYSVEESHPLDLEIGTGNGFHFAEYAKRNPERAFVGFELKYKPLIQSIRRANREGCENARICRYDARLICDVFSENELNDVMIHFPDPYLKKKFRKRRLISENFLNGLYSLQRKGSTVFFKTDSEDYYDWALENIKDSQYKIVGETRDLHASQFAEGNFQTGFETIFLNQGLPIYYCQFVKE